MALKLTFDNIGGIEFNGVLYGRAPFDKHSGNIRIYDIGATCIIPINAPSGGRPVLKVNGPVWAPFNIGHPDGTFTRGGYLAPKTVTFYLHGGEIYGDSSIQQVYLGFDPGPYNGGIKIDNIDELPNTWTRPPYDTKDIAIGYPMTINGTDQPVFSGIIVNDGDFTVTGCFGIFASDTHYWWYFP